MTDPVSSAILRIHCPDRQGINAAVTDFIARHQGNILDYDQHVDDAEGIFFLRVEWDLAGFALAADAIASAFRPIAERFNMTWTLDLPGPPPRMGILVSKFSHCLFDLLARKESGEWRVDIPLIISNHPDLEPVARMYGIPFHHIPITKETKAGQERREIELLNAAGVDLVVLARYMQILSGQMVAAFPNRIINIHHSFLPAFAGARPYHAAHARGVKVIGATSHYVTEDLDEGPIIAQDVIRVSHKDDVEDLVRKGRDLEKTVLSQAVWLHLRKKVLTYSNKTVVFE
ncbi:MAG TPA: formyltetrahydrofolate deformylase [Kiritimatiellia bacterium]|nr:formyltetrahydrofolate deformylase [Kiritimatiellia bacterium]